MAIQGVDLKCYILALFIRDDGERFLLGSGRYEFKDKQRHFAANTMQNDVVEAQGNDGFLLAGQVKRPGSQSFDGYVGDGTTSKQEVEEYRRDFFSFFRKNFFYQVIYIFPDGTAVQRKRGFLVDAPTVQELYQIYPEYHVALNFEDVNYYSYSENASGEEEFAKSATISLSAGGSTGGLVWDELGAVSEGFQWGEIVTATGTEIAVQNDSEGALPITDAKIYGDTFQQTYSGKNLFNAPSTPSTAWQCTYTKNNDNSITITTTGTPTSAYTMIGFNLEANTQYTLSFNSNPVVIRTRIEGTYNNPSISSGTYNFITGSSGTVDILFYTVNPDTSFSVSAITINNLQLEVGVTATAFEPYVGGTASPNPDYPQDVQTVTGRQLVTVTNGSTSEEYEINLGDIELCKIGDYQDYIYRSGGEWHLHKETGRVLYDGSENWVANTNSNFVSVFYAPKPSALKTGELNLISNNFADFAESAQSLGKYGIVVGGYLNIKNTDIPNRDVTAFKTWLSANNTIIYYPLATSTDTLITNQALIEDLNGLAGSSFPIGESQLVVSASGNLVGELEISYYGSVDFEGGGFVWEAGGPSGPTTVEVDSIENVYPIWEVKGPATNPQLSVLTTTTTLRYNGTVAAGQTLAIDMMSKTAKLNGTSVIGNVSGEWVNFVPGNNRVVYTTNNANAESSTIYWQEVVG